MIFKLFRPRSPADYLSLQRVAIPHRVHVAPPPVRNLPMFRLHHPPTQVSCYFISRPKLAILLCKLMLQCTFYDFHLVLYTLCGLSFHYLLHFVNNNLNGHVYHLTFN